MPQNFLTCDRDQELLMPPSMREWLPAEHLAWFVIDAVEELDLGSFYAAYRSDGHGRAAHEPRMMVALVLYAYAVGERSSRRIERRCHEDVAFRVICAGQFPDHSTIARFRKRHEAALAELFTQVLSLCERSGLARVGTIAIDSTALEANASLRATRSYESIAREILAEADAIDDAEDALYGAARGDELPPELSDPSSRRARLREAKRQLEAERARQEVQAEAQRDRCEAHAEARRQGRPPRGRPPRPDSKPKHAPRALRANTTDPDSRLVRTPRGFTQGYLAQAAVNDHHLIVAAEVPERSTDRVQLEPMVDAARRELDAAGGGARIETVLADAGYFNSAQIVAIEERGTEVICAVRSEAAGKRRAQDEGKRTAPPEPRPGSVRERMARALAEEATACRYKRRAALVEPIFGDIKSNRGYVRLSRRGRSAARSEWRLIAATHNLRRLWRLFGELAATGTDRMAALPA